MTRTYSPHKSLPTNDSIDEGFTLVELLVIIVVLGILAAVVVFAVSGITNKGAVAACQADGATVETAIASFIQQNPTVQPTGSITALGVSQSNMITPTGGILGDPYLQTWPSNVLNYAFGMIGGKLYIEVPGSVAWAASPTNGNSLGGGILYAGPYSSSAGCAPVV